MAIWQCCVSFGIFSLVLVYCSAKNLATLIATTICVRFKLLMTIGR
jgi:hypothetical protein